MGVPAQRIKRGIFVDTGYTKKPAQTLKRGNFLYTVHATYTNYAGYTKKLGHISVHWHQDRR